LLLLPAGPALASNRFLQPATRRLPVYFYCVPMTTHQAKIDELTEVLHRYYTKEMLLPFFRVFLRDFLLAQEAEWQALGVPVANARKPQPNKGEIMACLAPFLADKDLFHKLSAALPAPMPAVVYKIIWDGGQKHESLEREFDVKAVYTNKELRRFSPKALEEVNPYFCLFRDEATSPDYFMWFSSELRTFKDEPSYRHFFYFPPELASHLKNFTAAPAGYHLEPVPEPGPGLTVFADQQSLFSELPVSLSYLQQGKLAISGGGTVAVSSYNKMRKFCGIKEFYPESADKHLSNIRTRFLVEMLQTLSRAKHLSYEDPVALLKQGFHLYQQGRLSPFTILYHLRGQQRVNEYGNVSQVLFFLLRQLPLQQWVKAENLLQYARYRELPLAPANRYEAGNYLYFEAEGKYGKEKQFITLPGYRVLLSEPLLLGSFFLFATFGLVDVAYEVPGNVEAVAYGKPYISVFDGLQAVRLTPLGAYIGGLSQEYLAPRVQEEKVELDDQHLFMSYSGANKSFLSILEQVGRRAGGNLYKVDYESLLTDCSNQKEVKAKIGIFKQLLPAEIPAVWQTFFADLQARSLVMPSRNEEFQVFKLPDNKELIRLIATDDFLKKNCIKAEMFHVLIAKENVSKVKNYLKKYGFLIDFK
jgi:hypothetical protein